jgi:hypothetical protein
LTPIGEHQKDPPHLTGVWQGDDLGQLSWIQHLFRTSIREWTFDRRREFIGDHAVLVDRFVNARPADYYSQFRGKRVFLVDLADENYDFHPEIYSNFLGVFRCYWSEVFRKERVHPVPLGISHHSFGTARTFPKSSERQYIWSFLGQINKSSRPEIAKHLGSLEPHVLFATDEIACVSTWNQIDGARRRLSQDRCHDILLDSVFVPAAMGNVNLECWRVYEALESGAIPIVEKRPTLDYFSLLWGKHPIPTVNSWKEARRFVCSIMGSSSALDALQAECVNWWAAKQDEWTESIHLFIQRLERIEGPTHGDDFVHRFHRVPGWQVVELLRHHNLPAIKRRLFLQAGRLLSHRRMRVSFGASKKI